MFCAWGRHLNDSICHYNSLRAFGVFEDGIRAKGDANLCRWCETRQKGTMLNKMEIRVGLVEHTVVRGGNRNLHPLYNLEIWDI